MRRKNLPDPLELSEKLKGMTSCQALELGINMMSEAGAVLYVQHTYSAAVADNFAGDEFFGADRKLDMKAMMKASVKEVQKLSADTKKGGRCHGRSVFRSRGKATKAPKEEPRWKSRRWGPLSSSWLRQAGCQRPWRTAREQEGGDRVLQVPREGAFRTGLPE